MNDDDDRMDVAATCRMIGGTKPINPATLWRGVRDGRYSPPDRIGPNMVRFRRSKIARDLERIAADEAARRRDEPAVA